MTMLKIEPNVVDPTADFSFGNVTVSSIQTSAGTVIDGILEKNYNIPGGLKATTGTSRWWIPTNITITKVICGVNTAPTGSAVNISVLKNGSSVTTTSVAADSSTSSSNVSLSLIAGDYITVDITQVGSGTPGSDLVVTFLYHRT